MLEGAPMSRPNEDPMAIVFAVVCFAVIAPLVMAYTVPFMLGDIYKNWRNKGK